MFRFFFIILLFFSLASFFSESWSHEKVSFTRVEFISATAQHSYLPGTVVLFKSIGLQTKFLVAGSGLKTFSPTEGLKSLQENTQVSIFSTANGFDWGDFQYPQHFDFQVESLNAEEYHGAALSLPHSAPWFQNKFLLTLEIRKVNSSGSGSGQVLQVLHQGPLENPLCFVEYIGAGLRTKALDSQDPRLGSSLSMIRAVISCENFSYTVPQEAGNYELKAEFFNVAGLLLGQGIRYFEVKTPEKDASSIHLFAGVSVTPLMRKGESPKIVLALKDGEGQAIIDPQKGYIRHLVVTLKKENVPTMKDSIIRDFYWMPLPKIIPAKLPLEIPFNESWLDYFGSGTVYFSFQIVREYLKEEELNVAGQFEIQIP
jgi:hypothetical protein